MKVSLRMILIGLSTKFVKVMTSFNESNTSASIFHPVVSGAMSFALPDNYDNITISFFIFINFLVLIINIQYLPAYGVFIS